MIVTASSINDAEEALLLQRLDLIMTDVRLEQKYERGGLRLLENVRERFPSTAVIVISGSGSAVMIDEAYRKGALYFFEKPFDMGHLSTIVHDRLGIAVNPSQFRRFAPERTL